MKCPKCRNELEVTNYEGVFEWYWCNVCSEATPKCSKCGGMMTYEPPTIGNDPPFCIPESWFCEECPEHAYKVWCRLIAERVDTKEFIAHFREHIWEHFKRHDTGDPRDLKTWIVSCLNFMRIMDIKFPDITTDDLLYKLCRHYKGKGEGPDPPFDIDNFMERYSGDVKE